MKHIKKFENNTSDTKVYYEWYKINNDGSEKQFTLNRDLYEYDNYDLDSMVDAYIKVKGEQRGLKIKKVTTEDVDLSKNQRYILKKDAQKYNL